LEKIVGGKPSRVKVTSGPEELTKAALGGGLLGTPNAQNRAGGKTNKDFSSKSLFFKDLAEIIAKVLIPEDVLGGVQPRREEYPANLPH